MTETTHPVDAPQRGSSDESPPLSWRDHIRYGLTWSRFWRWLRYGWSGIIVLLVLFLLAPSYPDLSDDWQRLVWLTGGRQFDFVAWEVETLLEKGNADLAAGHLYLDEVARKQVVLDYMNLLVESRQIEARIEQIYVDPSVPNPDKATAVLQAKDEALRTQIADLQPLAEAILEEQVAAVLYDEGFYFWGHVFPPVRAHMTPLPTMLVVSPRDEIRQEFALPLQAGLLAPEREEIETAILTDLNRSGYVTNIGGLGIYPAMVMESTSLTWLVETFAHEWTHHYLTFFPLGLNYLTSPELRTMNESVASIVGKEIGQEVIRRYYPELAPPPPPELGDSNAPTPEATTPPPPDPNLPPPFDFRAEMYETRVTVDRLLAEGKIEAAEFYMEARRRFFVENGYNLRVLNQAYFAFHGAYADVGGARGRDPVGPLVTELRAQSDSLKAFVDNVAFVTSLEALEEAVNQRD